MTDTENKLAARYDIDLPVADPDMRFAPAQAAKSRRAITEVFLTRAAQAEAQKTAELEAYVDVHRQHASSLLHAKIAIVKGLMSEMTAEDTDGNVFFDTKRMDTRRLKLLQEYLVQIENRAFGSFTNRVENVQKTDLLGEFLKLGDTEDES